MFGRKPSPEAVQSKRDMRAVKLRLTKVERRMQMLDAQVNVLRRTSEEDDERSD